MVNKVQWVGRRGKDEEMRREVQKNEKKTRLLFRENNAEIGGRSIKNTASEDTPNIQQHPFTSPWTSAMFRTSYHLFIAMAATKYLHSFLLANPCQSKKTPATIKYFMWKPVLFVALYYLYVFSVDYASQSNASLHFLLSTIIPFWAISMELNLLWILVVLFCARLLLSYCTCSLHCIYHLNNIVSLSLNLCISLGFSVSLFFGLASENRRVKVIKE